MSDSDGCPCLLLEAYVDGELSPDRMLEVEEHIGRCQRCQEALRFDHAVRCSLKRVVTEQAPCTAALEARVRQALDALRAEERAGAGAEAASRARPREEGRPLGWKPTLGLATAAGVLLVLGAQDRTGGATAGRPASTVDQASSMSNPLSGVEQLVDQLVSAHANGTTAEPQVLEPALVDRLEPEVGVPVRLPHALQNYGFRFEGGSVIPVKNDRALSVRYRLDRHRVTLYVYDARRLPLRATLEPRVVRNLPVYVGVRRGYSVAAVEQRGVGYAVTSDLSDRESAELVAASAY